MILIGTMLVLDKHNYSLMDDAGTHREEVVTSGKSPVDADLPGIGQSLKRKAFVAIPPLREGGGI
jgi:hypothetical protein